MKKLINILSILTVTSSIMSFTIECDEGKDNKFEIKTTDDTVSGKPIDIDKITSDMIINWKDEYSLPKYNEKGEYENKMIVYKTNNLSELESNAKGYLSEIIHMNLYEIIKTKITGLPNYSDIKMRQMHDETGHFSDLEVKNHLIWGFLKNKFNITLTNQSLWIAPLNIQIHKDKIENNIITFNITLKKWDEIKYLIQLVLDAYIQDSESLLKKTENEIKEEIIQKEKKWSEEELEVRAKNRIQYAKIFQKINLDSIKTMYDLILIKEEGETIVVNLNPKS